MTRGAAKEGTGKSPKGSQRFLLRIFVATLIPVILAGTTFLSLSLYLFLRQASFLRLKEVRIEGNRRLSTDDILALAELEGQPNILTLDMKGLRERLGRHPWIEKALIRRVFPDGIRIVIRERHPLAVIPLGGRNYYVDEQAVLFDQVKEIGKGTYPILKGLTREELEKGEGKARRLLQTALRFLKLSQGNEILPYESISEITLDRAIGLLVYTADRKTEFRMGFDHFEEKLQRLSRIWPVIQSMEIASIDCTVPRKIIVNKRGERG